jgi:Ca-activated chloride channel family protein
MLLENFSFAYENIQLLVGILIVALVIHLLVARKTEKRAVRFSNYETLKKLTGRDFLEGHNLIPLALRVSVLILMMLAITNFVVTYVGYRSERDFMIAIDTSPSMLAPDIPPNRLEAAKSAVLDLIEKIPEGTKLGIVIFAGRAELRQELTDDKDTLKRVVDNITFGRTAGTAMGDAMVAASLQFPAAALNNSAIIIITDGKSNVGIPLEDAVQYASGSEICVFPIGIGSPAYNISFTIPEEYMSGTVTIAETDNINETALLMVANMTNGSYYNSMNRSSLAVAFEDIVLRREVITIHPTFWLIALAIVLFLVEWGLGATKFKALP